MGIAINGTRLFYWLEPDNLGLVLLSLLLVTTIVSISSLAFGFLVLLCSLTAGAEETESSGEHLTCNTLDNCDNVASVQSRSRPRFGRRVSLLRRVMSSSQFLYITR